MATSCKVSTQGYFFLPVVSSRNRWHLQWFRIYPIFKCHMFLLFCSGLSNQRKMLRKLGFLHDEKTTLSHATSKIISHCKYPAARVSASTLLVQRFLPALDKEQTASGGADSAEHSNIDTTKLAVRKFKLKLYTRAWSLVHGVAGNSPHLPPQNCILWECPICCLIFSLVFSPVHAVFWQGSSSPRTGEAMKNGVRNWHAI